MICHTCKQPINPDKPYRQSAEVDIDNYGNAISTVIRSYHLGHRYAFK